MLFEELISALGLAVNTKLTIEDGSCVVSFDDMPVQFLDLKEDNIMVLNARIGSEPLDAKANLFSGMLMANHLFQGTGGATLSMSPDTREFYLCQTIMTDAMTSERFLEIVDSFVNTLEQWMHVLEAYNSEDDKAEEKTEEDDGKIGSESYKIKRHYTSFSGNLN